MQNLDNFQKEIGIQFTDKDLLAQAFTHRSFLNENKGFKGGHNERLEFLGDAVLEIVVTDFLYRNYPNRTEGDMTSIRSALVNSDMCAEVARSLNFNDYLLLSRGEMKDTGRARQYILANALEAVIGAIYVDGGYDQAKEFIYKYIMPKTAQIIADESWVDAKSRFQERSQDIEGVTPMYRTLKEAGPDHSKIFTVGVFLRDTLIAEGTGDSKQAAEQSAARNGLKTKEW